MKIREKLFRFMKDGAVQILFYCTFIKLWFHPKSHYDEEQLIGFTSYGWLFRSYRGHGTHHGLPVVAIFTGNPIPLASYDD